MWPPLVVIVTLLHAVGFTRESYRTEGGQLLGEYVWTAWYTAYCVALGLEAPAPRRYVFPPLEQAAEAVYSSSGLDAEEIRDMLVAVAGPFAILGDWDALGELAAAAVQTFRTAPG